MSGYPLNTTSFKGKYVGIILVLFEILATARHPFVGKVDNIYKGREMTNRTVATLLLILTWVSVHAQASIILSSQGRTAGENIQHPNGNVFDQVMLTEPSIKLRANPNQINRFSFMDEDGGHCASRILGRRYLYRQSRPSYLHPPAFPSRYNQEVEYVTGMPSVVIEGADSSPFFSIFTVGRINVVNQALFPEGVVYDAERSSPWVVVINSTGMGGIQLSNTVFSGSPGKVGIDARGVSIAVRLTFGDIDTDGDAVPLLLFSESSFTAAASNPGLRIPVVTCCRQMMPAVVVAESRSTTPGFETLITQNNF